MVTTGRVVRRNGNNQNAGNVITDRPSTRVHYGPGGAPEAPSLRPMGFECSAQQGTSTRCSLGRAQSCLCFIVAMVVDELVVAFEIIDVAVDTDVETSMSTHKLTLMEMNPSLIWLQPSQVPRLMGYRTVGRAPAPRRRCLRSLCASMQMHIRIRA